MTVDEWYNAPRYIGIRYTRDIDIKSWEELAKRVETRIEDRIIGAIEETKDVMRKQFSQDTISDEEANEEDTSQNTIPDEEDTNQNATPENKKVAKNKKAGIFTTVKDLAYDTSKFVIDQVTKVANNQNKPSSTKNASDQKSTTNSSGQPPPQGQQSKPIKLGNFTETTGPALFQTWVYKDNPLYFKAGDTCQANNIKLCKRGVWELPKGMTIKVKEKKDKTAYQTIFTDEKVFGVYYKNDKTIRLRIPFKYDSIEKFQ